MLLFSVLTGLNFVDNVKANNENTNHVYDDRDDIYHYITNTETGEYSLSSKNVKDKPYIDIVNASYELNGNNITMSMTVDQEIPPSDLMDQYCYYMLYYGNPNESGNWHSAGFSSYSGNGVITVMEELPPNARLIEWNFEDPLSEDGKTFTASFEIQTIDSSFRFWAVAKETEMGFHSVVDPTNPNNYTWETDTYIDVAPFNPGEWAGSEFSSSSDSKYDMIEVPENDGSTIYKKIGDEINITLFRSIACKWELDDFDKSVLSLEKDFNWSIGSGVGDPGNRTWIFEAIGQGQTTLKFTSIFMGSEPYSIYGTYVLNVAVDDESDITDDDISGDNSIPGFTTFLLIAAAILFVFYKKSPI